MENTTAKASRLEKPSALRARPVLLLVLALLVLAAGLLGYRAWNTRQTVAAGPAAEFLSASELEERYGLRVRLIGVTAGGGMVDFRLKVLDTEKAQQLLTDPERRPSLIAVESGVTITAPQDSQHDLPIEEGGVYFVLFPNRGSAIQPGGQVIVAFGDLHLEPMLAQ